MSNRRRIRWCFGLLAGALALLVPGFPVPAQEAAAPTGPADPLALLKLLVGTWEGEIDGRLGTGKGIRRYQLIMGDRYLLCRHLSVRVPQPKSPKGDQHEELAVFSFDTERKAIVYREFMNEGPGIIIRSRCEVDGTRVVCNSEAVENGPGIRARLTLEIADRYRFTEIYEIAWPGKELQHYFTNRWTRSPLPHHWD